MHEVDEPDPEPSIDDQLRDVVNEMLGPHVRERRTGAAARILAPAPFDYSKPNQHDSKAEYNRERETVEAALAHIEGIVSQLLPSEGDLDREQVLEALRPRIDEKMRSNAYWLGADSASALIRRNAADHGGVYTFLFLCFDMRTCLEERLRELDEQRDRFWNIKHRAPDYYAREIALRLARVFARETGRKPTLGTGAIDGAPSTAYSRALAQVFSILKIRAHPRGPADWAVKNLTDEDMEQRPAPLMGLFGAQPQPKVSARNALIAALLKKK